MNAIVLLACMVIQGGVDDDAKRELARFQGVWMGTEIDMRGTRRPASPELRFAFVVVGDTYTFSSQMGTLKLNPGKHEFDLVILEGSSKGKTIPGIY